MREINRVHDVSSDRGSGNWKMVQKIGQNKWDAVCLSIGRKCKWHFPAKQLNKQASNTVAI